MSAERNTSGLKRLHDAGIERTKRRRLRGKRRRCDECGATVVDDRCALCESDGRAADTGGDFDDMLGDL